VTDIDIDSMSQTVDSLRQDLSTTDKIYSEHISELSEIIVQQDREIAELHNSFNDAAARAKNLQTQIEKQKVELAAHEEEMDAIKAIGYEGKVGKLQDDLRNIEEQRRKHQDALENAHEGLTIKLTIFRDQMDERRKKRDHMLGEVSNNLEKLQTVQVTINQLLRELDELINKQASDANKDTVGASLENEKESLGLKLRWASEERDIITRDLQEAIRLTRDKQQEIRDQEDQLRELRRQISDLRVIIEEKKRIIAELEAELEKANERIDYLTSRIRDLDAEIAELERALYERELRIRELSDILGTKPEPEVSYRAVRGDEVDEMLAQYLQDCPVPVKRLGGGFYLFGTRKIFAKIMNGRLVVRVGGGYMFISEFIATYSEPEIAKLTKICENLGIDSIWDLDLEELHYNKGGASPMRSPHGRDSSPKGFGNASFKKSMKGKSGNAALNGTNRQKKFNASAVIR
jgi:chromosome segregation ATPase